jgi:hypothetical protein
MYADVVHVVHEHWSWGKDLVEEIDERRSVPLTGRPRTPSRPTTHSKPSLLILGCNGDSSCMPTSSDGTRIEGDSVDSNSCNMRRNV